ncbi:hypothetical protein SDC9_104398 [bioreactor metagenome]|uniref:Uncharacterized protein n=1 Tax=bioreactor metagenome TaxID=1076179 RepID=A0A645AXQ6_9ZZZZ
MPVSSTVPTSGVSMPPASVWMAEGLGSLSRNSGDSTPIPYHATASTMNRHTATTSAVEVQAYKCPRRLSALWLLKLVSMARQPPQSALNDSGRDAQQRPKHQQHGAAGKQRLLHRGGAHGLRFIYNGGGKGEHRR